MRITVKLFASFRTGRFSQQERACAPGDTAARVLYDLGIADSDVGVLLVNGKHVSAAHSLAEGDTLAVFPLVGGG